VYIHTPANSIDQQQLVALAFAAQQEQAGFLILADCLEDVAGCLLVPFWRIGFMSNDMTADGKARFLSLPLPDRLHYVLGRLQGLAGSVRFGDGEDVLRLQGEIREVSNWLSDALRSHDA
jgi:hypothetical protein